LLCQCRRLLSPSPLFVLLNTYTSVLTRGQIAGRSRATPFVFAGNP
jgi:hypothetical protein